jgi:hypothetical protein
MTETIRATPSELSANHLTIYGAGIAASGRGGMVVNVPLVMPRSQTYYWSAAWQRAEHETLAAIEAGDSILFDSDDPEDVVRWLRQPDAS